MVGTENGGASGVKGIEIGDVVGIEMGGASEIQGRAGSNRTVFGGESEVKVS